jgi:SPX domain protein involved in polyphosphate accumulation
MNDFGKFFRSVIVARYDDKYIPYPRLVTLIERMSSQQLNSDQEFYTLLDSSHKICKDYSEEWLQRLYQGYADSPSLVLQDILELNQFVYLNQEALQRILTLHDQTIPNVNLMFSWK